MSFFSVRETTCLGPYIFLSISYQESNYELIQPLDLYQDNKELLSVMIPLYHSSSRVTVCLYFSLPRPALSSFTGKRDNMRQGHNNTSVKLSQNKWKENFAAGIIEHSGSLINCVFESKWEGKDGKRKKIHCLFATHHYFPKEP